MIYDFKIGIDKEEFDTFVKNNNSTFMQLSSWANVKKSWKSDLVGLYENGKLSATALVLRRKLFFNKYLMYIPRGFVIDYSNYELLEYFVKKLKEFAKKNNVIDIKIDPFVCFNEDNIKKINGKKNIEVKKVFTQNTNIVEKNILKVGFKHAGLKKEISAYIQPRYTMAVALKDLNNKTFTKEELRLSFPKNTRNYIGKYHEQRGVEFSHSHAIKDVKDLVNLLKCTEKRQNIVLRNQKYFESLLNNYKDKAVLFFARVDVQKYIDFLKNDIKDHPEKEEFNKKQIDIALNIKEKYGNKPLAAATIVIMPTNEIGNKVASFLYAGTNTEIFPSLKITNGLMFYRLSYCLERNCDFCDLGGVDGRLNDHLSNFKSKFNPQVLELIGEYDLIINKLFFWLFNISLKIFKKIR